MHCVVIKYWAIETSMTYKLKVMRCRASNKKLTEWLVPARITFSDLVHNNPTSHIVTPALKEV